MILAYLIFVAFISQACSTAKKSVSPSNELSINLPAEIVCKDEEISKSTLNKNELPGSQSFYSPNLDAKDVQNVLPRELLPTDKKLQSIRYLTVKRIELNGNTVLRPQDISNLTDPYKNKPITLEQLHELRHAITECYVSKGYITSGAILPDQEVQQKTVRFDITEGKLPTIIVQGNKTIKSTYIENKINDNLNAPLNVNKLRDVLKLLEQDVRIKQVNAQLLPGEVQGESILRLHIVENQNQNLAVSLDNYRPPSVGSSQLSVLYFNKSISGNGDILDTSISFAEGLNAFSLYYDYPVSGDDSRVAAKADYSDAAIIEEPFDQIDIESELTTFQLFYNNFLINEFIEKLNIELGITKKHSESLLLSQPFSFSVGANQGEVDTSSLYIGSTWIKHTARQIYSLSGFIRSGLHALGATENYNELPTGEYSALTAQAQYTAKLNVLQSQITIRTALQLSDSPLLSVEKFSVGGVYTVRGYRENQLVRDNGIIASLEWKIPISIIHKFHLLTFLDYGQAWNHEVKSNINDEVIVSDVADSISSLGFGIFWRPTKHWRMEAYYGYALEDVREPEKKDLQDYGIHCQLMYLYNF